MEVRTNLREIVFLALILTVGTIYGEIKYVDLEDSKYEQVFETFAHNLEEQYSMDKGETIETIKISKYVNASDVNIESLPMLKEKNATFSIGIFDEEDDAEDIKAETLINVGCPRGRSLLVEGNSGSCVPLYDKKYSPANPSFGQRVNFTMDQFYNEQNQLNFSALGCHINADYYELFKPKLLLYGNEKFVREVTVNYVLEELNGRNDYTYSATMKEVSCVQRAQTWVDFINNQVDAANTWTPQNYKSCFVRSNNSDGDLNEPYEILNTSGVSSIVWQNEGVYIFKASVVDPAYSFCELTTIFAVYVTGIESTAKVVPPFLVLGTSTVGLMCSVVFLFLTNKYLTTTNP